MEGQWVRVEWSHLSGAPGGELATYSGDGWRFHSAICWAGRLLSTALHTWLGHPCGAGPALWWPGDQLPALQGRGWQEELSHAPQDPGEGRLAPAAPRGLEVSLHFSAPYSSALSLWEEK
jgi:hypothetical protein